MKCPGCDATPPATAIPDETIADLESRLGEDDRSWWDPAAWWCPSCLAARVLAAHDDTCRCGGCRPPGKKAAAA